MGPLRKVALLSFLVTCSAGQVDRPDSVLDGLLKFMGTEGLLNWALGFISEFGGAINEKKMDYRLANARPDLALSDGQHQDHHGRHGKHAMWQELRSCHQKCGWDHSCHEKCPKPWELMQKKCEEHKTIKSCHKACHHDFKCHKNCPLPTCEHKAQMMKDAMDCHGKCIVVKGGRACHTSCPKPFKHVEEKCERVAKAVTCHKACVEGDRDCHHKCFETNPHHRGGDHHGHHGWHHHEQHEEGQQEEGDKESHRGFGSFWHHHSEHAGEHGWHHHEQHEEGHQAEVGQESHRGFGGFWHRHQEDEGHHGWRNRAYHAEGSHGRDRQPEPAAAEVVEPSGKPTVHV